MGSVGHKARKVRLVGMASTGQTVLRVLLAHKGRKARRGLKGRRVLRVHRVLRGSQVLVVEASRSQWLAACYHSGRLELVIASR